MVSGIVTAILLASFIAGTAWAFSARRRSEFEMAANLPLDESPGATHVDANGDAA
jgi:cytochrome c oxidase cbb3-type subunit 4